MPLLNYTTKISGDKSVAEISKALAKVGARRVMYEYDDNGSIVALFFEITLNDQPIGFRLPTDWKPVLAVMQQDSRVPRPLKTQEQALRVAWRITKDWVEAQAAYIETQMVTTAQVFLPYAVTHDGRSMYQYIAENSQILIGDGK
jgi:hypothetical protein